MNFFQAMFKDRLQRRLRSIAARIDLLDDSDFSELESLLLLLVEPCIVIDSELLKRGLAAE
jgi:hypothetical protein